MQLLAVACACLVPAAAAQAAAPQNDVPTAATQVAVGWTSLAVFQDVVVQATDWGDATTGPEDADPLPSCTGTPGFRSMWYSVIVPEAAVLRVTVVSTDPVRFQPVVSVLTPSREEVACGLANDVKQGSTANATAYVTPGADGTPATSTYLVRVAEVVNNSPVLGLPTLTVRFAARDVTPPHVKVLFRNVQPSQSATYDASGTTDLASGVNPQSAHWDFHDKTPDGRHFEKTRDGNELAHYTWATPGAHQVDFSIADAAGNVSMYKFTTFVQDTVAPTVSFFVTRLPAPGAHRLRIQVDSSESVRVRLLVTQVGRRAPLYRKLVKFWGAGKHSRSVQLRGAVGKGIVVISGIARDAAGNATALRQCWIDPVPGQGGCTSL